MDSEDIFKKDRDDAIIEETRHAGDIRSEVDPKIILRTDVTTDIGQVRHDGA